MFLTYKNSLYIDMQVPKSELPHLIFDHLSESIRLFVIAIKTTTDKHMPIILFKAYIKNIKINFNYNI